MKAFVFDAPNKMVWKDVERPTLTQPYGAILKPIMLAPCTSDVHTVFEGGKPKQENHILGHECIAEIVEVADGVLDFKVGDIVAVPSITPNWRALSIQEGNDRHAEEHFSGHRLGRTQPGTFAEYFSVNDADTTLARIPKNVTKEQALMCVDMMTTGLTGAEEANIKFGDTVCVIGVGGVGLMAIAGAVHLGASRIFAVGNRAAGVELAKYYGATDIIDYKVCNLTDKILEETQGVGVDSVIIAGGNDEVFTQAVDMVRYGIGTISNVNYFGGTGYLKFPKFSGGRGMAGKTINTNLAKGGRVRIERMMKLVSYGRIDPTPLVTHKFYGFEQLGAALEVMRDKPNDLIKAVVYLEKK